MDDLFPHCARAADRELTKSPGHRPRAVDNVETEIAHAGEREGTHGRRPSNEA